LTFERLSKTMRTTPLNRSDINRMAHTARRRGRPELPPEIRIVNEAPNAMRLAPAEKERTQQYAAREGRSLGNFARRVYLKGLAQYEAEQAGAATSAT
jgi:hypothetical protein